MIKETTIRSIEDLLKQEGLSQRQIARLLGVSRGTVQTVATGKRDRKKQVSSRFPLIIPGGPARRCPYCGAKVQMPCLACQLMGHFNKQLEA